MVCIFLTLTWLSVQSIQVFFKQNILENDLWRVTFVFMSDWSCYYN